MCEMHSRWAVIPLLCITATLVCKLDEVSASGEICGGTIRAGSGVITSPRYPDPYPPSTSCTWVVQTQEDYRIRLYIKLQNCSGVTLQIYDGHETLTTPAIGQFCNHGNDGSPPSIDSSGHVLTVVFDSSDGNPREQQGFVLSYESIDPNMGARILWTETLPDRSVRMSSLPDDVPHMLRQINLEGSLDVSTILHLPSGNSTALDILYGDQKLFFFLNHLRTIFVDSFSSDANARGLFGGSSQSVRGIAVDSVTGNVYLIDASYDWILILNANGTRNSIIIDDELDIPSGIAVHPSRGLLFWTDAGAHPKVERSNLAGNDRKEIATSGVVRPQGIVIDYDTDRVYWVDADPMGNRIEVSNLDGSNRTKLYESSEDLGLYDLAISGDVIYATGSRASKVVVLYKENGLEIFSLDLETTPYSIVVYAPDIQPPAYSPCLSNPCNFMCVGTEGGGFTCICGLGFLLAADGRTCRREPLLPPPKFVVASESKLCLYTVNLPDMSPAAAANTTSCVTNVPLPIAVVVDVDDGEAFHSVAAGKMIKKLTLQKGAPVVTVTGGARSVRGLATDWLTKHLYWTDFSRGTIEVSKYDGSYRTTLLSEDIHRPHGIVVDPNKKLMFWADVQIPGRIERASLDGTERTVIATDSLKLFIFAPRGLAIDYYEHRVYYADTIVGVIESMDYNGEERRTLITKTGASYFDMELYKDYILWTELSSTKIYSISRYASDGDESLIATFETDEQVFSIATYAHTQQKVVHSPCRVHNGGCDQLCLSSRSSERGYVCKCSFGYDLAEDNTTCISDLVQDNFFLVTDSFQRAIFQIDMTDPDFIPRALSLHSLKNAIAVTFDPAERKVYWTDVDAKTLSRAPLIGSAAVEGSGQEVIAFNQISVPDGIAVDSVSRLLYWTDAETHTISVSHLDGSNRKTLINDLLKPRAIVLQPVEGLMFWTDWGFIPSIQRSNMDGSGRSKIVLGALRWPNGLALDSQGGHLYWCDAGLDKIETSDLSGQNRRVLIDFGFDVHPYDIVVVGSYIYWTDWNMHSILRADKMTGSGNVTVGPRDYARPNALYVVARSTIPTGNNQCSQGQNGGCSGLCLPRPSGKTCACADGYELRGDGVCVPDLQSRCPMNFTNGGVRTDCVPLPGNRCQVQCRDDHFPAVDEIVCQPSGRWDMNVFDLCRVQGCPSLPTPPNARPGPCPAPHAVSTSCTHECEPGYVHTGGDKRRICMQGGEWLGMPIICEDRREVLVSAACNHNLRFAERPESQDVGLDKRVSVSCKVESSGNTSIAWLKNGRKLETDDIFVGPEGLTIPLFQPRHEGVYACVVMSGNQECLRAEANITYNPLAAFRVIPRDAVVHSTGHVFHCSSKVDTDSVIWLKGDVTLQDGSNNIRFGPDSLTLLEVAESDEGRYTCVLRDRQGIFKDRAHAWLYLSEPPQIDISEVCGISMTNLHKIARVTTTSATSTDAVDGSSFARSDFLNEEEWDINLSGRILGGTSASRGSAPYMVRLWYARLDKFACGGTLLDQTWVLTAAHCLVVDGIRVGTNEVFLRLGDYDSNSEDEDEESLSVSEIIMHENFNRDDYSNDIALLRLTHPLRNFTENIRPICLAPPGLSSQLLQPENEGRVTGWGETIAGTTPRFPKEVMLPFVEPNVCQRSTDLPIPESHFCAGYRERQEDSCQGDSGGPYAMLHEGRWYQLGIVSSGEGCAAWGKYGYYTDVTRFIPWLRFKNVTVASSPEVEERFPHDDLITPLAFRRQPRNMTVQDGSAVSLQCVPNREDAEVTWYIHDMEFTPALVAALEAEGVQISPTGLSLDFQAFPAAYAGWYGCRVRVQDGSFGLQTLRVRVRIDVAP